MGGGDTKPPGEEDKKDWRRVLNQNLLSTTTLVDLARPYIERTNGNIICISSSCGSQYYKGAPISYSVSKAALNSYIKSMASISSKMRINGVAPGNIMFEGSTWDKFSKENPDLVERVLNNTALKRFGTPQEVAEAVCFLASERARFITGTILEVDGGFTSAF